MSGTVLHNGVPPHSHDFRDLKNVHIRGGNHGDTASEVSGFSSHRSHHSYNVKNSGPYLEGNLKLTDTV